jgi:hypothetical protein
VKQKKIQSGEIQVIRKKPPGSFPANFVHKDNEISIYFKRHGQRKDVLVIQSIKAKAISRKGIFPPQWLFECPRAMEKYHPLYRLPKIMMV